VHIQFRTFDEDVDRLIKKAQAERARPAAADTSGSNRRSGATDVAACARW